MLDIRYYALIFLLILPAFVLGCSDGIANRRTGPILLSEHEAINLAREKAGLIDINSVELTTAGPIYRLILGKDSSKQDMAVWIDKDIVFSINLKEGVPRSQIQELLLQKSFDNSYQIQLIYVPNSVKSMIHTYLKKSSGNVFWWISSFNVEKNHQMFIDFYDGSIVYEF